MFVTALLVRQILIPFSLRQWHTDFKSIQPNKKNKTSDSCWNIHSKHFGLDVLWLSLMIYSNFLILTILSGTAVCMELRWKVQTLVIANIVLVSPCVCCIQGLLYLKLILSNSRQSQTVSTACHMTLFVLFLLTGILPMPQC